MSSTDGAYWERRALRYGAVDSGLPAVCAYGMPRMYNEAIHVCQHRALAPLLAQWRDLDVLDAGCGVGRWSVELARRGNRVFGFDISETMVRLARDNARRAGVDCRFGTGSVTSLSLPGRFDVVLAVTVLQHITGDAAFHAAVRNLASHLKPNGTLVLLEVSPARGTTSCDSAIFRARTLASYAEALAQARLELTEVRGVDAQATRRLCLAAMRMLPTWLARALVSIASPLALPFELAAARLLPSACWHHVIAAKPVG